MTIDRTSAVDNVDKIVKFDGIDHTSRTRYNYGLNNRFYAKRVLTPGRRPFRARSSKSGSRRAITPTRTRRSTTCYTDRRRAWRPPSHFSPIGLSIRAMPANDVNASLSAEFDSRYLALRTISHRLVLMEHAHPDHGGLEQARIHRTAPEFNNPKSLNQYITATSTMHTIDKRVAPSTRSTTTC